MEGEVGSGGSAANAECASASVEISGDSGYKLTRLVRMHSLRWRGCWGSTLEEVDDAGSGFAAVADMMGIDRGRESEESPFYLVQFRPMTLAVTST